MGKHTLNKTKMTLNLDRDVVLRAKAMKLNCSAVAEAALAARTGPHEGVVSLLGTCSECGKGGFDIHAMTSLLPGFPEVFVPRAFDGRKSLGIDEWIGDAEVSYPMVCLSCRDFKTNSMLCMWRALRADEGKKADPGVWLSRSPRQVLVIGSLLSRSTGTPRGDSLVFPEGWILRPGRVLCPTREISTAFLEALDSIDRVAGGTANLEVSTWGGRS